MLFMGSKLAEGSVLMQVSSAACSILGATDLLHCPNARRAWMQMVYRKQEEDAAAACSADDSDREARLAAEESLLRGGAGDYPAARSGPPTCLQALLFAKLDEAYVAGVGVC